MLAALSVGRVTFVGRDKAPTGPIADLLVIGSPPTEHYHDFERLRSYAKTVLIEKPMGHNTRSASLIRSVAEDSAQEVYVNYELRHHDVYDQLLGCFAAGLLPSRIVYQSAAPSSRQLPAWYHQADAAGTCLHSIGSHVIDLLLSVGVSIGEAKLTWANRNLTKARSIFLGSEMAAPIEVSLDLDSSLDQFTVEFADGGIRTRSLGSCYDVVAAHWTNSSQLYPPGTLRSSNSCGIWRSSQRRLLASVLSRTGPSDAVGDTSRLATVSDALRVHKIIDTLLLGSDEQHERCL